MVAGSLLLLAVLAGRDEGAVHAAPAPVPSASSVPPSLIGPPRGPLAGDTGFVDAVRRLAWHTGGMPEPPLESRWVVYAGDVPGARWALVVTGDPLHAEAARLGPAPLIAAWLGGPAGATPDRLSPLAAPVAVPVDGPAALLDQRSGVLVVVAAPGDEVEVSERPGVAGDGTVFRTWRRVAVTEGVAVARLRPSDVPVSAAAAYRVLRGGRVVARETPQNIGGRPDAPLPVAIDSPRGPPSPTAAPAVRRTAGRLLSRLGPARHEIALTLLWSGTVPGSDPGAGQAAVVALTQPSGAVVVDGEWLRPVTSASGDYLQHGDCGFDVLPAGPPVTLRVLPLVCGLVEPGGRGPVRSVLVVVGPHTVTVVRVYDRDSTFLAEFPAVDGVVVAPLPAGTATVEAVTAGGVGLGRSALLGRGVDFGA